MRKLAVLALAFPSLALASGYSLPNTNPRDLALSASAVAAQNDSGAAFAMPASLARLNGPSARIAGGGVSIMTTWKDPTAQFGNVDNKAQYTPLFSLSAAYGGRSEALGGRGWGAGLGVEPFGGSVVSWPADWAGRYRIVKVDRQVLSGVLTGGIEVIKNVRLGGGLVYYFTREKLTQNAWMVPYTALATGVPDPTYPDANAVLDANGGAFSYDVSAEAEPFAGIPLTIAVDYKHKATQEVDGDATWTGVHPAIAAIPGAAGAQLRALTANQGVKQTLTIPNVLNVGLSYRVIKPLLLTGTYTFDRWVVYDEDVFVGDNGAQIPVPRNYSNGWTIRAGAEYDVAKAWTVRAGFQRDHSGLDPKFYSPTLPDASSWAGSLGATYRFGHGLSLDAAAFYAIFDEVKAEDPNPATPGTGIEPGFYPGTAAPVVPFPEGTFRGTYNTAAFVFGLALGWTPGAK